MTGPMASGPAVGGTVRGRVAAFDDPEGSARWRPTTGGTWFFHCTAIADGTRTIAVGAAVDLRGGAPAASAATRPPTSRPA